MNNVIAIIKTHGGLEALKHDAIRVDVPGFMRLCIEYIGPGPRGQAAISIAHYFEQNGDLCKDPDVVMEVLDGACWDDGRTWAPVSFQQDIPPIYNEACGKGPDGQIYVRPGYIKNINSFVRLWDKNIGDQGFVVAAVQALGRSRGIEVAKLDNGLYATRSLRNEIRTHNIKFDDLVAALLPLPQVGRDQ